ncbi:lipid droplet-associated protein [Umezawaea beigongshangensis]|uniref:lipid droplet-associated protein n=1 Tax=Umezawaea beigongshangensis TaxID=2780383 RepID=UPI0018F1CC25|nr:lipid droplet-associated protein [Umezawaea beigongshangensis]
MKPLPLPVRIAAGLAATALEQARELPRQLAGLPVTVVSEALQLSMRLQQQVTELAIKGDDVLAMLRPVEETPEWATFDEDEPGSDPWQDEQEAIEEEVRDDTTGSTTAAPPAPPVPVVPDAPVSVPGYDHLSLPQLRARLRTLSETSLEELLAFERSHAARPEFIGMLSRRIANVRVQNPPPQS